MSSITRVAIVSDTHGFLDPRVAESVRECDIAVHAGDIMGAEVLLALQPRSGAVYPVLGNNDVPEKWPVDEHDTLMAIPEQCAVDLPGGTLAVEHGHRIWDTRNYHRRLRQKHAYARAVVFGHTHNRVCDTQAVPWVLNPGAAGRVRTKGGPSFMILHAGALRWRIERICFEPLRQRECKD